ncbi:hypothetical protein M2322_002675 [Rhodoblastus acidophilus]|uniref:hypothetical protein n=1 Tax=Rhodoblastus acidophilus TaxID=1074 RepID=UPI002223FFCD|nr:hypothetical protein [Rhodoblastus acidophilus]MCW2317121.1 hypothetical protein [Rhodoblastus acidophilus]
MSAWVLILILYGTSTTHGMTVEFNTQEACEAAAKGFGSAWSGTKATCAYRGNSGER